VGHAAPLAEVGAVLLPARPADRRSVYGGPIRPEGDPKRRPDVQALTDRIMGDIAMLVAQARRRAEPAPHCSPRGGRRGTTHLVAMLVRYEHAHHALRRRVEQSPPNQGLDPSSRTVISVTGAAARKERRIVHVRVQGRGFLRAVPSPARSRRAMGPASGQDGEARQSLWQLAS
jgi:hypothetical protein